MSSSALLPVFLAVFSGVFAEASDSEKVSVLEGDCFTLLTNVTEIHKVDMIIWIYEFQSSIIAKLLGKSQLPSLYDVDDGRFSDRLELDNQTGSLSVCDARTKHSGDYQLKIISSKTTYKTFSVTVYDVVFAGIINKKEGETLTLQSGISDVLKHDMIAWMFGSLRPDTLIAEINTTVRRISYGTDGRFRDRLRLEDQTGSLSIRNSRSSDTGVFQIQVSNRRETFYKRYNVIVAVPESALSPGLLITLISLAVLVVLAASLTAVCYCYYCRPKDEVKTVYVKEGKRVTLKSGVTKLQGNSRIRWRFGPKRSIIAQTRASPSLIRDERFRDRLQINSQTGDLTVTDAGITDSGDYQICSRRGVRSRLRLVLFVDFQPFSEGETVFLESGLREVQRDDRLTWSFGSEYTVIAKRDGDSSQVLSESGEGRFRDRLKVDPETGSLLITNSRSTDSGDFHLRIKSKMNVSYKSFRVTVWLKTVKVLAGDSATLGSDLVELEPDCKILWMHGEKDTCISKFNKATNTLSEYRGNDVRFRDRLKLDQRTGALSIWNVSIAHSDVYKLRISSGAESSEQRFALIAEEVKVCVAKGARADLRLGEVELQRDALLLWTFGPENRLIAKADVSRNETWTHADGRLELDLETGSLSVTHTSGEDSGLYKLKIFSITETRYRSFRLTVCEREAERNEEPDQEGIPLLDSSV